MLEAWNNLIYDWGGGTDVSGIGPDEAGYTFYLYNNTIVDCRRGIESYAGTVIAKNNLAYRSSAGNYVGAFNGASTNNLAGPVLSDARAPTRGTPSPSRS